ncbi:PEP-CTERM sorting domain-containing protein [Planktothrix sp. FACHB-1365]|uniref:PEP-CTERM sorting domain-containing protein n=1 Tax=Planktothrix sp. FACHB-1365 TaxID=2692855 RepID=UPI001688A19B|nr:PEP-CTERM sorting domain-containing protein [Planktothrix sp. FACHB-1365]MBD2480563.1 PEP-CTERM sorting domain-containing protein [Planktothrix sp. FACHB-1365]
MATSTLMKKLSLATASAALMAMGVGTSAQAASLTNSTGLTNPTQTINFNEVSLGEGEQVTNQFSSLGVSFTNLYNITFYNGYFPNIAGNTLANFSNPYGGSIENPFSIKFNTNQTAAAFSMISNPGTSIFTALLNGAVVETFNAVTQYSGNFYGFTDILFDEILVNSAQGTNGAALIDNLQTVAATKSVPEPASTLGLLALGAMGAGSLKRKQQQKLTEKA